MDVLASRAGVDSHSHTASLGSARDDCVCIGAGISCIDSAGLGLLLSIYATLRIQGGDLKLLNVGAPVKEALTITNLTQIFEIFEDENRAIASKGQ